MKPKVQVRMDPVAIAGRRGLGENSAARRFLAQTVARRCDKYVPLDTGMLKNSARVARDGSTITYPIPYAAEQFYTPYRHRDPNRGDHWHLRMLRREREALLRQMGDYLKGGGL